MASLSVRKVDPGVLQRLRVRAAKHGVSMEEEVRQILRMAVSAPDRLGDFALECFSGHGAELELPKRPPHEPLEVGR